MTEPHPSHPTGVDHVTATEDTIIRPARATAHTALFWIAYLAILFGFGITKGFLPPRFRELWWGVASLLALLALTGVLLRRDGRTAREVGLGWSRMSPPRFIIGLVIGALVYATMLGVISIVVGPLDITRTPAPGATAVVIGVSALLALGAMEEVGFRAYPLWTLASALGTWWSQLIVALAFALVHVAYGWAPSAVVSGVLPSALLFGAAAVATRGLALPLGIHVGMNICLWLMGEKSDPGMWKISVGAQFEAATATYAPMIGLVVTLAWACAITVWGMRRGAGALLQPPENKLT